MTNETWSALVGSGNPENGNYLAGIEPETVVSADVAPDLVANDAMVSALTDAQLVTAIEQYSRNRTLTALLTDASYNRLVRERDDRRRVGAGITSDGVEFPI